MGRQLQEFEKFYGQAMAVASGSGSVAAQGGIQENRMGVGVVGWGPLVLEAGLVAGAG